MSDGLTTSVAAVSNEIELSNRAGKGYISAIFNRIEKINLGVWLIGQVMSGIVCTPLLFQYGLKYYSYMSLSVCLLFSLPMMLKLFVWFCRTTKREIKSIIEDAQKP